MSIIDGIKDFQSTRDRSRREATVALTTIGKKKSDAFSLDGPKFDIVSTLNERGAMSIGEISQETGMTVNKVGEITNSLIRSGYVKKVI